MKASSNRSKDVSLQDVVEKIHRSLADQTGGPTLEEIGVVCDVLYAASLLKEEGNVVRVRVVIAPPDGSTPVGGPPAGIHAVRFTAPHPLTPNEVKRMSPAADFFHSVLAIWPDRDRGFMIWGILNTGTRWLNLVGGGRKPTGDDLSHPVIHIRDPGWLLFYHSYDLIAEWRGREFHGPRMDVFQSRILNDRFAGDRQRFVAGLIACCLPPSLNAEVYAELAHLISLQFADWGHDPMDSFPSTSLSFGS